MAEFDSNPFADPENENPFAGSTTQQTNNSNTLDDYNPFAQKPTNTTTPGGPTLPPPAPVAAPAPPASSTSQPAAPVIQPATYDAPPPYQPAAAQHVDTSELQRRQEELERKAAELQEREERLRAAPDARINNWPPMPDCCKVKPCFYQNFEMDIPTEFRKLVRFSYYMWIYRTVWYLLNMLFAIGYVSLAPSTLSTAAGSTMGLSILFFFLFVPASFLCWYRPIYNAFRNDSSINFFLFFIVAAVQIVVDLIKILGVPGSGFLGILSITGMVQPDNNQATRNMGIVMVIPTCMAFLLVFADVILLVKVHRLYRGSGASLAKAQTEFTQGVLTNEQVRNAGTQIATDAATNAMNNAASGNRY